MNQEESLIASELSVRPAQVAAAIALLDEGNTIPFIARYRKEKTGGLDDEQLRTLSERLTYLRNLAEKKETVLASIESQGLLTDELKKQIEEADTPTKVDDLYRPYRPKRRTRATIAREKGLAPLAEWVLANQDKDPASAAADYIDPEKEVENIPAALQGAADIIAEDLSDDAALREWIRDEITEHGTVVTKAKDETVQSVYEMYYDFTEAVKSIAGHRILAINRGEAEKVLTVKLAADDDAICAHIRASIENNPCAAAAAFLGAAAEDAFTRLIRPSIENEIRTALTERAEDGAIHVFGENLRQLLMQPPIAGHVVLGWDPAFRTGCKLSVVDETGKVLDTTVIYPTPPQNKTEAAKAVLKKLIKKYGVTLISLGNGTASRESEQFLSAFLKEENSPVQYVIVNEAGASVYSASKLGAEEFPDFDPTQRGAVSMARRLQDPLSELVKIEPASIGVGQYQHDMNKKKLNETLGGVVEDCVNRVGVDLNTASAPLMEYIAGISKAVAGNIVSYREENGRFASRRELLKVPKLGPKTFEQCAGFMRITGGKEPLDQTAVHPESYKAAKTLLKELKVGPEQIGHCKISSMVDSKEKTAEALGIGVPTLSDIIAELEKPARDPREDMPRPILRSDVMELTDLKEGMVLKGTVRNIMDFGAFVDIGVHQDGLVHISEMADKYVKHPLDVVKVGDIVEVRVISVDVAKNRIGLSMKSEHAAGGGSRTAGGTNSSAGGNGGRGNARGGRKGNGSKGSGRGRREDRPNDRGSSRRSSSGGITIGDLVGNIKL